MCNCRMYCGFFNNAIKEYICSQAFVVNRQHLLYLIFERTDERKVLDGWIKVMDLRNNLKSKEIDIEQR